MTPFWWSFIFGGICFVAAVVISLICLRMFARDNSREDARLAALRTSGMGDIASVEPSPIHDQLAAEFVVASAGEVLAGEWARADVYDVDDWPGAS